MDLLAKALTGPQKKLGGGLGGPKELYFAAVYKSLKGKERKWLWCWYASKKDCEKNAEQEGCIPFVKTTSATCSPKVATQWSANFEDADKKKKSVDMQAIEMDSDAYAQGFEMLMRAAKEEKKLEKEGKTGADDWETQSPEKKWEAWEKKYRKEGLSEEKIAAKKKEFLQQQKEVGSPEAAYADSGGKGKGKGKGKPDALKGKDGKGMDAGKSKGKDAGKAGMKGKMGKDAMMGKGKPK